MRLIRILDDPEGTVGLQQAVHQPAGLQVPAHRELLPHAPDARERRIGLTVRHGRPQTQRRGAGPVGRRVG
ncbi:hypothetical protein D3C72_835630 [compost metagenome]